MLNERSQTPKAMYYMVLFTWHYGTAKVDALRQKQTESFKTQEATLAEEV